MHTIYIQHKNRLRAKWPILLSSVYYLFAHLLQYHLTSLHNFYELPFSSKTIKKEQTSKAKVQRQTAKAEVVGMIGTCEPQATGEGWWWVIPRVQITCLTLLGTIKKSITWQWNLFFGGGGGRGGAQISPLSVPTLAGGWIVFHTSMANILNNCYKKDFFIKTFLKFGCI